MDIAVHASVSSVQSTLEKPYNVTLQECLNLYFNEETLASENAWMCPYCRHRLPCAKTLSLWTTPDVFLVHLKRFRQSSFQRMKIATFVEFPFTGLDMNPYVALRNQNIPHIQANPSFWSPWKRSRSRSFSKFDDNIYELYAVCSHHGSMQGGHYTAYCRNPVNNHWYLYDDLRVQKVAAKEALSRDAYILFYQRSSLSNQSCASSSSSGYSSSSSIDHWAFHMAAFLRESQWSSKSQDTLYDIGKTSSLDRRNLPSQQSLNRSLKAYSNMQPATENRDALTQRDSAQGRAEMEIPPPPPPTRHYWTVTSV